MIGELMRARMRAKVMSGHQAADSDCPRPARFNLCHRGKTDSWITPRFIIDALGPFDLDPCQCTPQPWPCGRAAFTAEDDGLSRPWRGRVWLNPPYGPDARLWLERLAKHGNGIALTFARTDTQMFFDSVWPHAAALLFFRGRLYFYTPDGTRGKNNAGAPSVLIAYGRDNAARLAASGLDGKFLRL